jgi:hypothetical protein
MPGLAVTSQAQRLWGLSPDECEALLERLVAHQFLRAKGDSSASGHACGRITSLFEHHQKAERRILEIRLVENGPVGLEVPTQEAQDVAQ